MMPFLRALLLLVFFGLFQNISCNSNDEILQFCSKYNISISELKDEADQAGISVHKLISMMNAEYPSLIEDSAQGNGSSRLQKDDPSADPQDENEDVLGFFPSSSTIYSSDVSKNTTIEEPSSKADLGTKTLAPLDTETLKLSENTLFLKKENKKAAEDSELKNSELSSYSERKPSNKHKKYKVLFVNMKKNQRKCKTCRLVGSNIHRATSEIGNRYVIINNKGEREEYMVVDHRPKLFKFSRANTNDPQRVKIIRRHIQPLIITQPNVAPYYLPMQIPNMPGHPGVVAPPQAPQIPQIPRQVPQQGPPTKDMNDFDEMNRNENYRYGDKNSFIGPMTISIIVIILIIICIIGGFCFCGTTGMNRNSQNVPLLPSNSQNVPRQPPYNSRAPIVPQNQQIPPQGRQVFGYAVVPNI